MLLRGLLAASLLACSRTSALTMHSIGTRLVPANPAVRTAKGVPPTMRLQREPIATMSFERNSEAMAVIFGSVRQHYLEPFVVGVVIRGLFELLAVIERQPEDGPEALRSRGAKWWPQLTRIPARWTCVAACVSLVDDYMFGAVGLVLGFLGSGRLMVMRLNGAEASR